MVNKKKSYLDSRLRQVDLHREILPGEDVRIVCLREGALQLLELLECEGGPVAALLPPDEGVVVDGRVVGVARVWKRSGFYFFGMCHFLRSEKRPRLLHKAKSDRRSKLESSKVDFSPKQDNSM